MFSDVDYLDTEGAIARIGGNVAIYHRLLKLFLAEDHIGQLSSAAESGDSEAVLAVAHALKGVCANLSLNRLKDIALEIELNIKAGSDYKDCLVEFDAAYQKTIALINDFLSS